MGKTSAAMVFIKEYLRIVERVHLISSTLHLDKGYEEIMAMIKKSTRRKTSILMTLRKIRSMKT